MASSRPSFQVAGQEPVDRTLHVWRPLEDDEYKCVLCGGISRHPSSRCDVLRYAPLTDQDRRACPPRV